MNWKTKQTEKIKNEREKKMIDVIEAADIRGYLHHQFII